jgi:hypothetical protein
MERNVPSDWSDLAELCPRRFAFGPVQAVQVIPSFPKEEGIGLEMSSVRQMLLRNARKQVLVGRRMFVPDALGLLVTSGVFKC